MAASTLGPVDAAAPRPRRRVGALERATRRTLRDLSDDTPGYAALSAYALHVARMLDEGADPALGREYRMTIMALTKGGSDDDAIAGRELYARLSAPLGHTAN